MIKKFQPLLTGLAILVVLTGATVAYLVKQKDGQLNQAAQNALQSIASSSSRAAALNSNAIQSVDITAKGGYSPELSILQADVPTLLRIHTQNTFDCSASLVISELHFDQQLPPSGKTELTIPPQPKGKKLVGRCSMGMYSFTLSFV